jgi:purine-binding chemotaxis protein CheW
MIDQLFEREPNMGGAKREQGIRAETGSVARTVRKFVVFRVADQAYGIPLDAVQEILAMAKLTRPAGLPPVLSGFLNLGGVAVPVVGLARLFGLAAREAGLYTPLLIVRCAVQRLALLVDSVMGITPIDTSSAVPVGANVCFNDCAEGLVTAAETNVILLSYERLLREQELRRISELTAIEQSRLASFEEERL